MSRPIVLDLCAGSGAWSQPYQEAGYDVRRIDLPQDVRLLELPREPVHGILAAPPCTYFCRMRMCRGRPTDEQFLEGLSVLDACLRLVTLLEPTWWALENPEGYLRTWLGDPVLKFHPCDYGDPWTKRTWLWGRFTPPVQNRVEPSGFWVKGHAKSGPLKQTNLARTTADRQRTPSGFAQAFFNANP